MKQVIYAAPNYAKLRQANGYLVDKTEYIAKLERVNNPIFLRPRRFGKSFLCSMLECYYDLDYKERFQELFGDTWIGQNPTGNQNKYIVLRLNFSTVHVGKTIDEIEVSFRKTCNTKLQIIRLRYAASFKDMPEINMTGSVSDNLDSLLTYIEAMDLPPLFVIIDEYDNFANQLIIRNLNHLYRQLVSEGGFLKTFFKVLKAGREIDAIENVYITGILPMTIDELASAFNVGTFLTLDATFEAMVGFTQPEVERLLDDIFEDYYNLPQTLRGIVGELIKNNYNGYHFVRPASHEEGVAVYNTTILMYFLQHLTAHGEITEYLTDENLRTDIGWMQRLSVANAQLAEDMINQLMMEKTLPYNKLSLPTRFNVSKFFDNHFFPISLFYLGLLTRKNDTQLSFPNLNIYHIFVEYFNKRNHLDTTNPFALPILDFIRQPDLEALFRTYWEAYVAHLPEVVFMQMNENFYRTTFYQVCMEHLSSHFIWNVERSYPEGKSDLEFIGKHNEKFAGMRWVIEFKYYSNSAIKKKLQQDKITLDEFTVQADDLVQIQGYVQGLQREYPEAQVSQFVIYCFGNQDFRVFAVD